MTTYHDNITAALTSLQSSICEKDEQSITRHNETVAALISLRDNLSTAINNATTLITTDSDGIAANKVLLHQM